MFKLLYGYTLESCQSIYSVLTDHRNITGSVNVVSVFHTLLTIQFVERSNVPGFFPTSQRSHVNLIDSQNVSS